MPFQSILAGGNTHAYEKKFSVQGEYILICMSIFSHRHEYR